jgi:hypothetical protein
MGGIFEFTCGKCGYRAEVSGRPDCGFVAMTETMVCRHCEELVDVLVGFTPEAEDMPEAPDKRKIGLCPQCRCKDVVAWEKSRPCPKCGGRMKQGDMILLWD